MWNVYFVIFACFVSLSSASLLAVTVKIPLD
jgi:hypothetical protein